MSTSPQEWREKLVSATQNRCGYCHTQQAVSGIPLTLEHIIPKSKGGETTEDNLWLSCRLCNEQKGILIEFSDPKTDSITPLYNPRTQMWSEHFAWNDDGTKIIGRTPVGRATIDALNLNDSIRIQSRALWVEAGWHPPEDD